MEQSDPPRTRPAPARRRRAQPGVRLTDSDLELLRFVAEQQLVHVAHVRELLRVSAGAASSRLRRLTRAGYLRSDQPFDRAPAWYLATRKGVGAAGCDYRPSSFAHQNYQHDLGLAWLWLAARGGVFGQLREVVSERAMRSADARAGHDASERSDPRRDAFGVRLGVWGETGKESLHYPDLLLITPEGKRVAVELELTQKPGKRLEKIMGGYALDRRIDAVIYLVEDRGAGPSIGRAIERAASAYGISDLVHVQRFQRPRAAPATAGRERSARRTRAPSRERGQGAER